MKYTRIDTPTITAGEVVRYTTPQGEISASRTGVIIAGHFEITSAEDFDVFVAHLRLKWRQYQHLKTSQKRPFSHVSPLVDGASYYDSNDQPRNQ